MGKTRTRQVRDVGSIPALPVIANLRRTILTKKNAEDSLMGRARSHKPLCWFDSGSSAFQQRLWEGGLMGKTCACHAQNVGSIPTLSVALERDEALSEEEHR